MMMMMTILAIVQRRLVVKALLDAGVPAISLQPAASALCRGGNLVALATDPIKVRPILSSLSHQGQQQGHDLASYVCCLTFYVIPLPCPEI